ncbi:type IV pilus modification PilV family protein [Antarcticirhabdus aurantiaca]|uniref:Prepilin-type N-terminal cleavage/methylation domain-containing protein n=1 Tax=Antarcticirhabdus aurantiaca TaxID=2606717 RepID=A0ACD4NM56_9HYPH|nr:prepilin-type N-terminal cleavage/methylation domain-containing protein [Antarcticirhabdus aurantiaca]WAJ27832.1 prepilin-type N-terminal cleavage/methylation domain-containing protein [Jeongeuplla avenae]
MTRAAEAREGPEADDGEAGFALVEVLVAFAILALVSLAMLRAFADTTGMIAQGAGREARLDLARSLLEEFRARGALDAGLTRGEAEGIAWAVEVGAVAGAGVPTPEGAARLLRLAVAVAPAPDRPADPAAPLLVTLVLAREGAP